MLVLRNIIVLLFYLLCLVRGRGKAIFLIIAKHLYKKYHLPLNQIFLEDIEVTKKFLTQGIGKTQPNGNIIEASDCEEKIVAYLRNIHRTLFI